MTTAAPRVLLLGDSHLARLGRAVPDLGPAVVNRARGGAFTTHLAAQADGIDLHRVDVAVVSVGTNDAAPWKQVPLDRAVAEVERLVARLPCPVVLLAPPGVDEGRLVRTEDRTNEVVARYAGALADVVRAAGGRVVETREVLAPLGTAAFVADGVHLTPEAYAALLPVVATAVRSSAGAPRW